MLSAAIYALDVSRLTTFYRELIGGETLSDPDGRFATISGPAGDFEVHIVAISEEFRDEIEITAQVVPRWETPIKLTFDVDDIETMRLSVASHGGSLATPEQSWTWRGLVHCDGVDPEGNIFQVRSPA